MALLGPDFESPAARRITPNFLASARRLRGHPGAASPKGPHPCARAHQDYSSFVVFSNSAMLVRFRMSPRFESTNHTANRSTYTACDRLIRDVGRLIVVCHS